MKLLHCFMALVALANKGFIEIVSADSLITIDFESVNIYDVSMISILYSIIASLIFEIGKYIKEWMSMEMLTLHIYTDIPLPGKQKWKRTDEGIYIYTIKVPKEKL